MVNKPAQEPCSPAGPFGKSDWNHTSTTALFLEYSASNSGLMFSLGCVLSKGLVDFQHLFIEGLVHSDHLGLTPFARSVVVKTFVASVLWDYSSSCFRISSVSQQQHTLGTDRFFRLLVWRRPAAMTLLWSSDT